MPFGTPDTRVTTAYASIGLHAPADGDVRSIARPLTPRSIDCWRPNVRTISEPKAFAGRGARPKRRHVRLASSASEKPSSGCTAGRATVRAPGYRLAGAGTGRDLARSRSDASACVSFLA